jgi:hypothetical protein
LPEAGFVPVLPDPVPWPLVLLPVDEPPLPVEGLEPLPLVAEPLLPLEEVETVKLVFTTVHSPCAVHDLK